MSDNQDATPPNSSKSARPPKGEETLYRVNRLGSEVFVGNKDRLLQAIQSRRVRGDDLIHDQAEDLWGFARKHPVFLEATGQGEEETRRARESSGKLGQWLRFMVNALALGGMLYLLIAYSETIEFKINEDRGEFNNVGEASQANASSTQIGSNSDGSDGSGSSGEGGEGEGGAGKGGESDGGGGAGGTGKGGDNARGRMGAQSEILQIFDLSAEGMESNPLVLEQNTLSDDELITRAQSVASEIGHALKERNDVSLNALTQLQEAYAIATFVETRNINHGGARNVREQLWSQLKRVCEELHSRRFCELKERQPRWSDTVINSVLRAEVLHGMTPPQVEAAWGRASKVFVESPGRRHCYGSGCERSVLVVESHVVEVSLKPRDIKRDRRARRRKKRKSQGGKASKRPKRDK